MAEEDERVPRWKISELSDDERYRMKRDAVLREAGRAFSKRGFHNTSLEEVARALNVTKAALYTYVETKQEILFECHKLSMDLGELALEEALAGGGSGLQMLERFLVRYMECITGEKGFFAVLTEIDALLPADRAAIVARRDAFEGRIIRLIQTGIDDGSIARIDPKAAIFTFFGTMHWVARWYSPEGRLKGPDLARHITDLLIHGLTAGRRWTSHRGGEGGKRRPPGSRP